MDRLTSLKVFAQVVQNGGFSAAAPRLGMSVTMVSSHIQALEGQLGARLLNRTTRKVSLTDIGREYYERSRQIIADLDEADRLAGAQQATPRGVLRLYANSSIVRFLAPVMLEYLERYEDISVDLTAGQRMVDLIEDGFDLVIWSQLPPESSLIVKQLSAWRHVLCCSPDYLKSHPAPVRLDDLAQHNCLRYPIYPFGDDWRFGAPDGRMASVRVTGNLLSNSAEMLRAAVLGGRGVMLAPSFLVGEDIATGRLVTLLADYRPVEFVISAIYPHRHHLSAKVRIFIDLLAERKVVFF